MRGTTNRIKRLLVCLTAITTVMCIMLTNMIGIFPVLAEDSVLPEWSFSGNGSTFSGNSEDGYTLSLKAGETARFNTTIDVMAGMKFKISNPTNGKYIYLGFKNSNDTSLGATVASNFVGSATYRLKPVDVGTDNQRMELAFYQSRTQLSRAGELVSNTNTLHTFNITSDKRLKIDDNVFTGKEAALDIVNNNGTGGYFIIYSDADIELTNVKPSDWALSSNTKVKANSNGGTDITFATANRIARYEKIINMNGAENGFVFRISTKGTFYITLEANNKTTIASNTIYDKKVKKYGFTVTDDSITALFFDQNNTKYTQNKIAADSMEYYHIYFVNGQLHINGQHAVTVDANHISAGYVSFNMSMDSKIIDFKAYNSDVNLDLSGVSVDDVNDAENEDGTHTFTAEAADGTVEFDRPLHFDSNPKSFVFPKTLYAVPQSAFNFSITAKGDLTDRIGIGAIGSTPSMQFFIRDNMNGNDTATTLSASYYDDTNEKGTFDFDYTYGKNIYVWMRYGTDVNRWSFAVEQPDGSYKIFDTDLYAYTEGAADYNEEKRFRLTFAQIGDKVNAMVLKWSQMPGVRPRDDSENMNAEEIDGEMHLSHDGEALYTFEEYLTFKASSNFFTGLIKYKPSNALQIKLKPDSIPQNSYLGVRLLSESDLETSKLTKNTLRFEIVSDNGDGTGVLGVSTYFDETELKGDYIEIDYKWGDPLYVYSSYISDYSRWMLAVPNTNGIGYRIEGGFDLWHNDEKGINSDSVAHQVSLISYNGIKNLTATLVDANGIVDNDEPPVPIDTAFTGNGYTESENEYGCYELQMDANGYAKSTWTADLNKGLIFRISDFDDSWVSICLSGSYWTMIDGTMGVSNGSQQTLMLRNDKGKLRVALYDGKNEIVPKTYNNIPATGTHILKLHKFGSNDKYYYFRIDGITVIPEHIVNLNAFDQLNNYNEVSETFDGAYCKFASGKKAKLESIKAFEIGEEKEINEWVTNTDATVEEVSTDKYTLDMQSYSSLRFLKMANLEKGITFKISEAEPQSQFGIAFGRALGSTSLDIPPTTSIGDIYYNFMDNGDGTVAVSCSDGYSTTIELDISKEHNFKIVEIKGTDGKTQYTLAIDGKAIFDKGMDFNKYIMLNNGSMGAFPTVFTKSVIKITDFTGEFKKPATSSGDENLWDDDWSDDDLSNDDLSDDSWGDDDLSDDDLSDDDWGDDDLSDDSWGDDDWGDDDWSDDDWGDDDWGDDSWSDDDWSNDDAEVENVKGSTTKYKKVLRRVKIERDPIIVEYSLWWLWLIISVVVVAGGVTTFLIIRKKKKVSK